jgi:hypothetical protein
LGAVVPCPPECADCESERRLFTLASKLKDAVGLHSQFTTCDSETRAGHHDSITVTNPEMPERGGLHIDSDGEFIWHFNGPKLTDAGMGQIVSEAAKLLQDRALPQRKKRM